MTDKQYKAPVLTEQQMAEFLMNHYSDTVSEKMRNEYRTRALAHLETIHEPSYAAEVRRLMETMYREKKAGRNAVNSKQR